MEYLSNLSNFTEIPRHFKLTKAYRDYLQALLEYLEGFYERTQPLASIAKHYKKVLLHWTQLIIIGRCAKF